MSLAVIAGIGACSSDDNSGSDAGAPVLPVFDQPEPPAPVDPATLWSQAGCTASSCHAGIEPIRRPETGMMQQILARGRGLGDPDGCTVCHGGDPKALDADAAHHGQNPALAAAGGPDEFFADPASPWVNDRSCGQCHAELVTAQWNSLMMTEAGKIQGTTWSFGIPGDYEHRWANYDTENPDDPHARLGTDAYRAYMQSKSKAHPNVFVDSHEQLPAAPAPRSETDFDDLRADPSQAAYTYIRSECQRCHLGVKGRQKRGDFRGMGCGACHLPYGNEGLYEGGDATIPRDEPGRPLTHSIQATRDAWVHVNGQSYTGIPVETCTTCHNRGKRIGVSYQGLMESAWASPYTEGGGGPVEQPGLHTKHYIAMEQDIHFQKGMLCQDCHTSGDVHGDGFLAAANLGPIEIECTDCHGTPSAMPWELPLGWGDEDRRAQLGALPEIPRGVATELPSHLYAGAVAEVEDGYILTARGNPMPEIVRSGELVLVHTAGGKTLALEPLASKQRRDGLTAEAEVAMVHSDHVETMECYACHASWAPQCYGCHVEVDYSDNVQASYDWVAAGNRHKLTAAGRAKPDESGWDDLRLPGKVTELRSYMRWEDPPLGLNGEGRVSPLIPGCQTSATIIGPDGETLALNQIFRTPPNTEGGGPEGQLGIDMSPVQPHTIGKSRSCESCHGDDKALGHGIGGGRMTAPWDTDKVVDLTTADGRVIPNSARTQIEGIDGLVDWSAVVDREGNQLQTVGHHFEGSGPLPDDMRARMDRNNVCVGCHQEIPDQSLAVSVLSHISTTLDTQRPTTHDQHEALMDKILLTSAWVQVLGLLFGGLAFGAGVWIGVRRLRRGPGES